MEEISPNNILKVSHISASYQEGKQRKTVLHDISFELHENEILGLVGESGCRKIDTLQSDLRIYPPR